MLYEFNTDPVESCEALIRMLDEQNERLEPHRARLMQLVGELNKAQLEIFAALEAAILTPEKESGDPA